MNTHAPGDEPRDDNSFASGQEHVNMREKGQSLVATVELPANYGSDSIELFADTKENILTIIAGEGGDSIERKISLPGYVSPKDVEPVSCKNGIAEFRFPIDEKWTDIEIE